MYRTPFSSTCSFSATYFSAFIFSIKDWTLIESSIEIQPTCTPAIKIPPWVKIESVVPNYSRKTFLVNHQVSILLRNSEVGKFLISKLSGKCSLYGLKSTKKPTEDFSK